MNLQKQNVLFFTRTMELGGTENVILQLCEILKPLVSNIVVCSCGGVNVEKLISMGIKHYKIPDIESKQPQDMIATGKAIRRVVKEERITVIHTHHRMAAFYVEALGLYKKCTFLNTSHNTFHNKSFLTRFAYKHAYLIACGEMVKKNLVEYFGISVKQVKVVHNAVKPFGGQVIEDSLVKELHKDGCFVIGNIGRLSEQKGMEYYIRAIPDVLQLHSETRFLIVGTGVDEEKLKGLVKELSIEDKVYFIGYRTDIQNLMSQIDLVVLSSLWEGLPLTPIEAFSVGKTIVATEVDGTVEIVENGVNGLLVEPMHPQKIAEKICWMIENPKGRQKMESAAVNTYETRFSFEVLRQGYIENYCIAVRKGI